VGARCRFEDLQDRGLGRGYDHLAHVHAELEEIQQQYGALLERFIDNEAPRVGDIRRKLADSRKLFEKEERALDDKQASQPSRP
jgi:hypothetical protein